MDKIPTQDSRIEPALTELRAALGDECRTDAELCTDRANDVSRHTSHSPQAVIQPATVERLVQAVQICQRHQVSMIAYGTGTGVEGGVVPLAACVSIDTSRLNRILEISEDDELARVQAGVTRLQLNAELDRRGSRLFFPIDPGADASLGGMAATNASGSAAVRYGTMRQNVLGVEAVLADGTRFRTGSRARKSSAGFDLTRLLVGSEGTLAILAEVTLRLARRPAAISAAVCAFPSVSEAIECVLAVQRAGIQMARIELLDETQMEASIRYSGLDAQAVPTLFFEFHGHSDEVERQAREVGQLAAEHGGAEFQWSASEEQRKRLWQARYDCFYAGLALRENSHAYVTDVCVPLSQLADCIQQTRQLLRETDLPTPMLGHVGDGNFHVMIVIDRDSPQELQAARSIGARIVDYALQHGGTCTGEHGVGMGKIVALETECGEAVEVMRRIKQALDPNWLLNPGKVLRDAGGSEKQSVPDYDS